MPGLIVVLSGPSGSGKTTIFEELLKQHPEEYIDSISATTRPPRRGEIAGQHYHFLIREDFLNKIQNNELIEWAEYAGHLYGTPIKPIIEHLNNNKIVLVITEQEGVKAFQDSDLPVITVFIAPPSIEELKQRLNKRGTDSEELEKRLALVKEEMKQAQNSDYIVISDSIQRAVDEIEAIISNTREKGSTVGGPIYPNSEEWPRGLSIELTQERHRITLEPNFIYEVKTERGLEVGSVEFRPSSYVPNAYEILFVSIDNKYSGLGIMQGLLHKIMEEFGPIHPDWTRSNSDKGLRLWWRFSENIQPSRFVIPAIEKDIIRPEMKLALVELQIPPFKKGDGYKGAENVQCVFPRDWREILNVVYSV